MILRFRILHILFTVFLVLFFSVPVFADFDYLDKTVFSDDVAQRLEPDGDAEPEEDLELVGSSFERFVYDDFFDSSDEILLILRHLDDVCTSIFLWLVFFVLLAASIFIIWLIFRPLLYFL